MKKPLAFIVLLNLCCVFLLVFHNVSSLRAVDNLGTELIPNGIRVVSVNSEEVQGNSTSRTPFISSNGRFIAFSSSADNLVPNDLNEQDDVFLFDTFSNETFIYSLAEDNAQGNSNSSSPLVSDDGQIFVFQSFASNLVSGDTNALGDIFIFDSSDGSLDRLDNTIDGEDPNGFSVPVDITPDGRFILFQSGASNFVIEDTNNASDVFVYDRISNAVSRVNVSSSGDQANGGLNIPGGISDDGIVVSFYSSASNLVLNDTNGSRDVFVHNRQTGITSLVSAINGSEGNNDSAKNDISGNGQIVVFESLADNFFTDEVELDWRVFSHNLETGEIHLISVGQNNLPSSGGSPSISQDGQFITYQSSDDTLWIEEFVTIQIFLYDSLSGETNLLSRNLQANPPYGNSQEPKISGDGQFVTFRSVSTELIENDSNGSVQDIFIFDQTSISDDYPPIITISSPMSGDYLVPGPLYTIGIAATASDPFNGSGVKHVEFYVDYDGVRHSLGEVTEELYEITWQMPTNIPSQQIKIVAIAEDNAGNRSEEATSLTNYIETSIYPDMNLNWIPSNKRFYLNQLAVSEDGWRKCGATSMAMVLAMQGIIAPEQMIEKTNEMFPNTWNGAGAVVYKMVAELKEQGLEL